MFSQAAKLPFYSLETLVPHLESPAFDALSEPQQRMLVYVVEGRCHPWHAANASRWRGWVELTAAFEACVKEARP